LVRVQKLLLLAFFFAMTVLPSLAEGELPSRSSEEAVKRGLLIKKVFPMPEVFDWNDHEVRIKESWYERNPGGRFNLLCFKLLIDESPTLELATQRREFRSMEFREDGGKETALIGTSVSYPLRNLTKFKRGLGELVHYVEIKNPAAKKVVIRLYTLNHTTDQPERTKAVLTFDDLYYHEGR